MPRSLMMPVNLQNLPVELICHIFGNLEMHDLLASTRYTIELAKHRMVSLLPASASPAFATRLKMLRDRERAWKYMDWKKRHTLRLPPTGSVYEFVGGLYGNGREDDSRVTASISFLELPSVDAFFLNEPHEELKMWTHAMGDVTIIDFTMDPSQDLLVLVALAPPDSKFVYELHLRSIRTNQPHTKAPVSVLPCLLKPAAHPAPSEIIAAVRVQVAGNMVALLIKEVLDSAGAHLQIWNWENNPRYSCSFSRMSGIDDFTFLTHDSFLLVRPTGRFEVYTFADPIEGSSTPVIRATYAFPALSEGYMYWYISMSSNPAPGYVPRSPFDDSSQDALPGSNKQIYYPRPDERIHACCLYIFNPAGEENHHVHSFVFFLNIQSLLNPPTEWLEKSPTPPYNLPSTISSSRRTPSTTAVADMDSDSSTSSSSTNPSTSPSSVDIPIYAPPDSPPPSHSSSSQLSVGNSIPTTYPPFPTFDSLPFEHHNHFASTIPNMNYNFHNPLPLPPIITTPSALNSASASTTDCRSGSARTSIASMSPGVHIPWEVWGPQSTRWFEECLSTDWQHAIYGLRTVESVNIFKKPEVPLATDPSPVPSPSEVPLTNGDMSNEASYDSSFVTDIGTSSSIATHDKSVPSVEAEQDPPVHDGNPNEDDDEDDAADGVSTPRRFLRIRDFNPYSFMNAGDAISPESSSGKGKHKARWRVPRLVTEPSTTPVKGVFTCDIVSSLPYMEVVSQDTFEVTDVMMDDCRLLLLKRGQAGKLKRVEVLMM
ncbi:hypothetical protein B0H34DRAFT_783484 [Crassisporium funariophilum]|nr:hypothetical protein B0H34DRAFT_783484 [Crassisporium funariophilum]